MAKPRVKLKDNPYTNPNLEWFDIIRGSDSAGELLAAFEMLEIGCADMPCLTEPKQLTVEFRKDRSPSSPHQGAILPVPKEVRPNLGRFKLEVLFWGLRDLKRIHFMSVDKPRIDVECSGKILSSGVIQNAKKNPNFPTMLKYLELELPVEEIYAPPITIRCVDCRSFGRYTLVGTHQITSIHRYMYKPPPKEDSIKYKTIGGQTILPAKVPEPDVSPLSFAEMEKNRVSNGHANEMLTLYGTACVSKL